jgi:poly-D-alanine transfer protein DltD
MFFKFQNKDATTMMNVLESLETMTVSRSIVVKTMITDAFREQAAKEDEKELSQVDANIGQLRQMAEQRLNDIQQAEQLSDADKQIAQTHLQQQFDRDMVTLLNAKQEVLARKDALSKTANGSYVTTGELQDTVQLKVGQNIYQVLRGAEILVKDGVITAMLG